MIFNINIIFIINDNVSPNIYIPFKTKLYFNSCARLSLQYMYTAHHHIIIDVHKKNDLYLNSIPQIISFIKGSVTLTIPLQPINQYKISNKYFNYNQS